MVANKVYFGNKESRFSENNTKVYTVDANGNTVALGIYCELLSPVLDFNLATQTKDGVTRLVRGNVEMGDKVFAKKPVHVRKVYKCLEDKTETRSLSEDAREFFKMMHKKTMFRSSTWVREIGSDSQEFLANDKPVCESSIVYVARAVISLGTAYDRVSPKSPFIVSEQSRRLVGQAVDLLGNTQGGKKSWMDYPVAVGVNGEMMPLVEADAVLDARLVLRRKQRWLGVDEKGLVNGFDLFAKSGAPAKYAVDENLRFCFDKRAALYTTQRAPRITNG